MPLPTKKCSTSPTRSRTRSSRSSPRGPASDSPTARGRISSSVAIRRSVPWPCSSAPTAASTWWTGTTRSSRTTKCRGIIRSATRSAVASGGFATPRSRSRSRRASRPPPPTNCRRCSAPKTPASPTSPGRRSSIAMRGRSHRGSRRSPPTPPPPWLPVQAPSGRSKGSASSRRPSSNNSWPTRAPTCGTRRSGLRAPSALRPTFAG